MAASLKAASLPGNNLAYTNAVFVNPAQSGLIRPTYKDTAFAVVNDLIYEIRFGTFPIVSFVDFMD
jgi:hypothetical protein